MANEFLLCGVFLLALIVSMAIGRYIGAHVRSRGDDSNASYSLTILGGSLGLLGLILGFTFSMAGARYDGAKAQMVQEANAVGTAFLRSRTLMPEDQAIARPLFESYADALIRNYSGKLDLEEFAKSVTELSEIQTRIWAHGVDVSRRKPDMVPTGIYLQALNEMIDQGGLRLNFIQYRVPEVIFILLAATALLTLGLAGYVSGLSGVSKPWGTTVFALITAIVIGVIVDLDRPRRGLIQVEDNRLVELRSMITSLK